MRSYCVPNSLLYFSRYTWYLRALGVKKAERYKILADINSGLLSRDVLESDWQRAIEREIEALRAKMKEIEYVVESIPETPQLFPCKLFLRLYFIVGLSMTDTASEMNVSPSTLRRIRDRAARHFDDFPPV